MSRSAYETPPEPCPYCAAFCEADFVDVGVGMVQCGPYHCTSCDASQIGPYDERRELSTQERDTGWYAPNSEFGSSTNVIGGKLVSANVMKETYKQEFTGNPRWHNEGEVAQWRKDIRKEVRMTTVKPSLPDVAPDLHYTPYVRN